MASFRQLQCWRKEYIYDLSAKHHYTSIDETFSGITWLVATIMLYIYLYLTRLRSAGLEPDDLAVLSDSTSEEVLDDLTSQHGLLNNAFNMLRADSAIPDTLASQ